eukprot:12425647-Karenia_brevis.AAC.1
MFSRHQEWRQRRRSAAEEVVDNVLSKLWINLVVGSPNDVASSFIDFEKRIGASSNVKLVVMNTASPSVMRADQAKFAYDLMGCIVNQPGSDNMCIALGPVHTNVHGQVYRAESWANQKLADANLNIDRVWGLLFMPPEDPRDERQLLYPGR